MTPPRTSVRLTGCFPFGYEVSMSARWAHAESERKYHFSISNKSFGVHSKTSQSV